MARRDWQAVVRGPDFSNVSRLVHLAARLDDVYEDRLRSELTRMRRRFYEQELAIQARRVGCGEHFTLLQNGPVLSRLNEASATDAASIVNTYNYDLAKAIQKIRTEVPTANRHVYAKRLRGWEQNRLQWKAAQIEMYTENTARSMAQQDFFAMNRVQGYAELEPKPAVCPVCQGWIARGNRVPVEIALNNPGPFHVGCPHLWEIRPEQLSEAECRVLWLGE